MLVFKHNPGSASVVRALGSRWPQVVEAVLGESLTASVSTLEFSSHPSAVKLLYSLAVVLLDFFMQD